MWFGYCYGDISQSTNNYILFVFFYINFALLILCVNSSFHLYFELIWGELSKKLIMYRLVALTIEFVTLQSIILVFGTVLFKLKKIEIAINPLYFNADIVLS